MVQLEDVTKAFLNGVVALRHVSLRIEPGEFVFVVGPTGTGKSTLLRLVYRDELPTSGRVIVYRRDVGRLRSRGVALLRRRLGVVFQDFKLLPARTAYDNVAFALRVIGTPGSEIRPRALRALALGDHPAVVADQRARNYGHRHHAQQDDRRCSAPARDSAGRRPGGAGPDARPLRGGGLMRRGAGRARLLAEQTVYFIAEALASFRRNGLMTVAAVTTIVVALLVVGGAVVLGLNLSHLAETLESEVAVVAFLHEGLTSAEITRAQRAVAALPGVASVRFVSRGEALLRLRHRLGDAGAFDDLETANPLPDSLEIRLGDPLRTKALAATAADVPGVEEATYGAQVTDRLLALTRGVRVLAALVTVFLASVALIVVVNTIRLTVIARRREIEIMQLVGATRWFIQWPLLLEGILEGTAAAAMATALLTGLYTLSAAAVRSALPFLPLVPAADALRVAAAGLCAAGILVGATGSVIAVRRFATP